MTRPTLARIGEAGTEFVLPAARLRDLVGAGAGGGVVVQPGAIVINARPGQDARAVAREAVAELGRQVAHSRRARRSISGAGRGSLFG